MLVSAKVTSAHQLMQQIKTGPVNWLKFEEMISEIANHSLSKTLTDRGIEQALQQLKKLDITASDFKVAVENAFESGNRYWLWQRLIKAENINGGILNISREHLVQLHDHPGATGMLRIISGQAEVWQYDRISKCVNKHDETIAQLKLVSRRIMKPGDMAVLTPEKGNVHALRSVSKECRMLDFFIPPYRTSQRSWYEPLQRQWIDKANIDCREIPQHQYSV